MGKKRETTIYNIESTKWHQKDGTFIYSKGYFWFDGTQPQGPYESFDEAKIAEDYHYEILYTS